MKSAYILVMIVNIIVMLCWTALAIHFGKWWVALFAVLCFAGLRKTDDNSIEMESEG